MFALKRLPYLIRRSNADFENWKKRNPAGSFKDFYAQAEEIELGKNRIHPTLGGQLTTGPYEEAGLPIFRSLTRLGLKADDVCVDYGCGTLRIGLHLIRFLQREAYFGLDISAKLLEEGRTLIGKKLWEEKAPRLRVISPESLAEVAAAKPSLVFSNAVLIHVHPGELTEYLDNLIDLTGAPGRAFIFSRWTHGETIQTSGHSWAHNKARLEELVRRRGVSFSVVSDEPAKSAPKGVRRCILRIDKA